jgi:cell division protein FtsW (lipid II flippase)
VRRILGDYPLFITALLLSVYGVAMVYSAGVTDTPTFVRGLYCPNSTRILSSR